MAAAVLAMAACSGSENGPAEPVLPGTIQVTVVTTGFMKDDSYELLVDGQSQGTISANDQIMLAELDPATYELALADVAANCTAAGLSTVELAPEETRNIQADVVCVFDSATPYTIRFSRARPNLDDGSITECPFSICPTEDGWDMYIQYTSGQAIVRANGTTAVELAHLPGVTLDSMTEEDFASAVFSTSPIDDPFDSGRVVLVKTDTGAVFALGNPVADTMAQTLSFDVVLVETAG